MGAGRTAGRTAAAAVAAIALTVFAALPAQGFRAQDVVVEPVIGPELPVSYPVLGPQYGERPAVAFGGSVYLVVWQSFTRGAVFARVDRAGTVLDLGGVSLGATTSDPAVAFDGTNFLVVWQDTGALFGTRVSPAGAVLDAAPIRLSSGPDQPYRPKLDFDGTNYFVVWSAYAETGTVVYATRVSPTGFVLEPVDLTITTAPNADKVAVAFNGTHHLVVWEAWDPTTTTDLDIAGTLVTTSGAPVNPLGAPISAADGRQTGPVVTALGTSFVVAWEDRRAGDVGDVYGSRVDATGAVLDPSGIAIAAGPDYERVPNIASDGTNALVAFMSPNGERPGLHVTRVDPSGTVLDPAPVPLPVVGIESAVTFGGDNYLAIGWDSQGIRGARVSRRAVVLDPAGITVSLGMNAQSRVDQAFDGTNHLVVWSDSRPGGDGPGLYAGRVGPDGQVLDGTGFVLAAGRDGSNGPTSASVAFDGTNYLVAWVEDGQRAIGAARVGRDGAVLDRFVVHTPTVGDLSSSTVAFGGGGYLVTWYSSEYVGSGGYVHTLHGARVGTDGQVVDPAGFVISSARTTEGPGTIDVAYGATNFLVVWDRPSMGGRSVVGARVSTQDPGPVPPPEAFPISAIEGYETGARVAWNGSVHLVVWQHAEGWISPPSDVFGARVDDAGLVLDPAGITISNAPYEQQAPSVAANGQFLVTWNDRRRGDEYDADLYATRVDPDGTVAHPDGFAVATSVGLPYSTGGPATAPAAGTGNFSVAYSRFVATDPYGSNRAFTRHVSPK